jgi:hypothetical protein
VRVLAAVVAVAEGHPAVVEVEDAVVGDGNAIDVAPEVADEVLRGVEGGLGMDDPVVAVQADQQLLPVAVVGQLGRAAGEGADGAQVLQGAQEDGAEHRREGERGEEEVLRCPDEGAAVALERAAGDQAMHVRMQLQGLPPGVQHRDDAEIPIPALAGEGLQCFGGGAHERRVDRARVVLHQAVEGVGQGEDEMEVLDRQQLQLSRIDPGGALVSAVSSVRPIPSPRLAARSADSAASARSKAAAPRRAVPSHKPLGMREIPRRVRANPAFHRVRCNRHRGVRYSLPRLGHQPRERPSTS